MERSSRSMVQFQIKKENHMDFKLGDVVRLKSGGAILTVSYLNVEDGRFASVDVVYFDDIGEFREQEFIPVECIELVDKDAE